MTTGIANSRTVIAALIAVSLATGAGAWLHARTARERVSELEQELAAARDRASADAAERAALTDRVANLESELAAATAGATAAQGDAASGALAASGAPASAEDETAAQAGAHDASASDAALPPGEMGAFDAERLVAAGFRREDVTRMRARLDEIQLKRLYLRDQATREGWMGTPRFKQESQALFGELVGLRTEFDEPLYDWVLYSTGHPNRVAVREVISGSAGDSAGLLRGDVIVRYGDQLLLSPAELRDATTQGRAGELVELEVQREGESAPLRIFVPRGPIGITLAPTAVQPAPAG
jgi:PDZ domain